MSLTPRQLEVLDFIVDFVREHRYAPTLREMADHFDLSKVTVLQHLEALEEEGYLDRQPHKARGITVRKTARLVLDSATGPTSESATGEVRDAGADADYGSPPGAGEATATASAPSSALPVLGFFSPGESIKPSKDTKTVSPADVFCDAENCYVLEVRGKALADHHILNGDLLVVNEQDPVENGDLVLAGPEEGPPTLHRYRTGDETDRLDPLQPDLHPEEVDAKKAQIRGKIVGFIRFP